MLATISAGNASIVVVHVSSCFSRWLNVGRRVFLFFFSHAWRRRLRKSFFAFLLIRPSVLHCRQAGFPPFVFAMVVYCICLFFFSAVHYRLIRRPSIDRGRFFANTAAQGRRGTRRRRILQSLHSLVGPLQIESPLFFFPNRRGCGAHLCYSYIHGRPVFLSRSSMRASPKISATPPRPRACPWSPLSCTSPCPTGIRWPAPTGALLGAHFSPRIRTYNHPTGIRWSWPT